MLFMKAPPTRLPDHARPMPDRSGSVGLSRARSGMVGHWSGLVGHGRAWSGMVARDWSGMVARDWSGILVGGAFMRCFKRDTYHLYLVFDAFKDELKAHKLCGTSKEADNEQRKKPDYT